jgi:hypothetical protein
MDHSADNTEELAATTRQRSTLAVVILVATAGICALFFFSFQISSAAQRYGVLSVSLAVAGAAFLAGGLVGFLFGIPRVRQRGDVASSGGDDGGDGARYTPNTNLEQISDWLTKILVGVGLTQIGQIGTSLDAVGQAIAPGLARLPGSKPFAVAIIVFFVTAGFLVGYLLTSLYLGRALTEADRANSLKKRLTRVEEQAEADARALKLVGEQLAKGDGARPAQSALDKAMADASPEARAHAFYRAEGLHDRSWNDPATKPMVVHTIPIFRALTASDHKQEFDRNFALLGYALMNQPTPDYGEALKALNTAIAIRGPERIEGREVYEANRAICQINLDPNFKTNTPTEAVPKAAIVRDLEVAASGEWTIVWAPEHADIKNWLKLNSIEPKSIFEPEETEEP